MTSELKLIRQAKNGKKSAFGRLINIYQDQILYLAFDYFGNYEEAKDTAQEIFIKVYLNIKSFNEKSKFKTWLYRIAINTCIDVLRKRQKKQEIDAEIIKDEKTSIYPDNSLMDDNFYEALKTLSEKQYTTMILKYFHDKSTKEIADILDCDINTVRTHQHRAIDKIKKQYR